MNPTDPAALPTPPAASLRRLAAAEAEAALPGLSRLLADCVVAGASVNFVLPFGPAEAEAFWRARMLGPLGGGRCIVLLAEAGGRSSAVSSSISTLRRTSRTGRRSPSCSCALRPVGAASRGR